MGAIGELRAKVWSDPLRFCFTFMFYVLLFIWVGGAHATVCPWGPEDSFQELLFITK